MIHRDLKSSNLLLSADWRTAKVCDLGLARTVDSATDAAMTVSGSELWMAPEIAMEKPYHQPADVFSYGTSSGVFYSIVLLTFVKIS